MHGALSFALAIVGLAAFFFLIGAEFVGLALVFIFIGAGLHMPSHPSHAGMFKRSRVYGAVFHASAVFAGLTWSILKRSRPGSSRRTFSAHCQADRPGIDDHLRVADAVRWFAYSSTLARCFSSLRKAL
jgi:hypothetical protein